ncbi:MAG: hypothetical protein Q9171_004625 [Xanthocarpia ochracea]
MSYTKDIKDSLVVRFVVLPSSGNLTTFRRALYSNRRWSYNDIRFRRNRRRSLLRGKHFGKIVISNREKADVQLSIRPAVQTLQLHSDASYLIVGGLKGACGTLAIHMAQHGARHIVVSSRSGLNDPASARVIDSCRIIDCEVIDVKGDVGDFKSVQQLFKSANPRIAGIVQSAMVLRTSGIVGNKGQANYAAANTFLDAFASYRTSLGLKANTVDLGLIEDIGYVAEQDSTLETRFDKRQWTPINEAMLRKILTYSILQQDTHDPLNAASSTQMITGIGYPLPIDGTEELAREPRFAYLFSTRKSSASDTASDSTSTDPADLALKSFKMKSGNADPATLTNAYRARAKEAVNGV